MDKKLEPKIRFKGFNDAWEQRKLKDVTVYFNGKAHEDNVLDNGLYELITLKSVSSDGVLQNSGKYVNDATDFLQEGTLIMILSEQNIGAVGMTAIIPTSNYYVLNQRVAELRPNSTVVAGFLTKQINKNQNYFEIRSAGTKVQNISKGNVENFTFGIPNVIEQSKISMLFENIDMTIAANQRKEKLLQDLKKLLMKNVFPKNGQKNPDFRFRGFTDDWEQRKLGKLGNFIRTSVNPNSEPNDIFVEYSMPSYDDNRLPNKVYGNSMNSSRFEISGKVLLINKLNVRQKRIWLVENAPENSVSSTEFMPFVSNKIDLRFLEQLLLSDETTTKLEAMSSGTSNSQKRISPADMLKFKIQLPDDVEEQNVIAQIMNITDNLITANQQKTAQLKSIKKFFMQNMFI